MKTYVIAWLLLLVPMGSVAHADPLPPPPVLVERLVTVPHGFTVMSGSEWPALLEELQRNPDRYVPLLGKEVDVATSTSSLTLAQSNRAAAAGALLIAAGPSGRALAVQKVHALDARVATLQREAEAAGRKAAANRASSSLHDAYVRAVKKLGAVAQAERGILDALAAVADPVLRDETAQRVNADDPLLEPRMHYLERVARGDAATAAKLQQLLERTPHSHPGRIRIDAALQAIKGVR